LPRFCQDFAHDGNSKSYRHEQNVGFSDWLFCCGKKVIDDRKRDLDYKKEMPGKKHGIPRGIELVTS
jgi:hypothetical protein